MFSFILYVITFTSLALWFYFKEDGKARRIASTSFLFSFAAYSLLAFVMPHSGLDKMAAAVHLAALFAGTLFLNTFSNSRFTFFILLMGMVGGYSYWQLNRVQHILETTAASGLEEEAELLVELSNGHQWSELSDLLARYDLTAIPAFQPESTEVTELDDFYAVNIPTERMSELAAIKQAFVASGLVDFVEENETIQLSPNAGGSAPQPRPQPNYGLNDPLLTNVWGFEAMKMDGYFELLRQTTTKPTRKARIAIIDTGVDAEHEDLRGNFVSIDKRYNQDQNGHGTHCAGIAAAVGNNKKGIASFSLDQSLVEVTSIQVFDKSGTTSQRRIINGMLRAADKGAVVLSMSLGGPSTDKIQRAYEQAVDYANTKGAIVVVAAGNENVDAKYRAPASVRGVITVSAIDNNLQKAEFSNFVQNIGMAVAAPGVQVYSTFPGGKYEYLSGTSMATPYVSGLIGVLKAFRPEMTTKEAFQLLNETGLATQNSSATGKLIHPAAALTALLQR